MYKPMKRGPLELADWAGQTMEAEAFTARQGSSYFAHLSRVDVTGPALSAASRCRPEICYTAPFHHIPQNFAFIACRADSPESAEVKANSPNATASNRVSVSSAHSAAQSTRITYSEYSTQTESQTYENACD